MANRLATEKSPYLLQHAGNPVDWFPWGEEAFAAARTRDVPIFLSIGYATCHWCHVMEHESFEDDEVARLLNDAFVCVKVDREERPDVDQVYMTACQMLTGAGGWPLTVVMTPDRLPFFAATYIPKHARFGRSGLMDLVPQISRLWQEERERVLGSAEEITRHLRELAPPRAELDASELILAAREELAARFDPQHGGFSSAPKFPSPHLLLFLLGRHRLDGDEHAVEMVVRTLDGMRRGGVYDQLGFGLHRYSTDRQWLVPHFEKMLYDQAMLVLAAAETHAATGEARFAVLVREILEYVRRDLSSPEGAFYCAEDADSEGEEGKFYVWELAEIEALLDPEAAAVARVVWGLEAGGNFRDEATGRRTGANIPHVAEAPETAAAGLGVSPDEVSERLERARTALLEVRGRRPRPLRDDKVLTDWNGLMVAACARAGRLLDDTGPLRMAEAAASFVESHLRLTDGSLAHRWRDGEAAIRALLDDLAFLAWGRLELYDATLEPAHLRHALELADQMLTAFADPVQGGFFLTAADAEALPVRPKDGYDGAIPSGSSVAAHVLLRLARLTGRADLEDHAQRCVDAAAGQARKAPSAFAWLLAMADAARAPATEVVVTGERSDPRVRDLLAVATRPWPLPAVLLVPPGEDGDTLRELAPFVRDLPVQDGTPRAYLCRDFACELPLSDPGELERRLQRPD